MEEKKEEVVYHAPDKLLAGFAKGRIVVWMLVAVAIHVVFVGMTSIGYIRDRLDPEGAKARTEAAAAAQKEKEASKAPAAAPSTPPTTSPTAASTSAPSSTDAKLLEERKNTPVVKRITEAAKTNEIPAHPGDIGISIDDTNVR